MDNKYIISVTDIQGVRPISSGIPQERIDPYILEAQFHDVRPILGDLLYRDFLDNFDNMLPEFDKYRDLLNGKTYTFEGQQYRFDGLLPGIVYFTLARFYSEQPINVTRFGLVQKTNDESTPLDPITIDKAIVALKSMAINHKNDTIKFIMRNATTYPLYNIRRGIEPLQSNTGIKFF